MDLRALHIFVCCAQCGSFHKAAARLAITPQAVSKSMRQLERRLQRQLFARTGTQTRLTPDGDCLLALVQQPLDALLQALDRLPPPGGPPRRPATAGCPAESPDACPAAGS